jgi:hypothetical protein
MSNPSISLRPAPHRTAPSTMGARLKAGGLTLLRELREFVKAIGSSNVRAEMLESAKQVAATQPELARQLRRAAYGWWY